LRTPSRRRRREQRWTSFESSSEILLERWDSVHSTCPMSGAGGLRRPTDQPRHGTGRPVSLRRPPGTCGADCTPSFQAALEVVACERHKQLTVREKRVPGCSSSVRRTTTGVRSEGARSYPVIRPAHYWMYCSGLKLVSCGRKSRAYGGAKRAENPLHLGPRASSSRSQLPDLYY
jgi:hypothetical protein